MNVKCIALDLDDTLLKNTKEISEKNREALDYCLKQGVQVVIASGRAFGSLPKSATEIPGITYAITSNGAGIYNVKEKTCLMRNCMEKEAVKKLLQIIREEISVYEVFVEGIPYASADYVEDPVKFGAYAHSIEYVKRTRKPMEDLDAFVLENMDRMESMDLIVPELQKKQEVWKRVEREVPGIYSTSSLPHLIEISHKNSGKHTALQFLLKKWGISPQETAAFGNGDNDWEMLQLVKYGIAVENASDKCKEAAWAVTASNEEDGVASAIWKYLA